ncbi:MAG: hypothetical protein ACMUIL_04195 [bacterium]
MSSSDPEYLAGPDNLPTSAAGGAWYPGQDKEGVTQGHVRPAGRLPSSLQKTSRWWRHGMIT